MLTFHLDYNTAYTFWMDAINHYHYYYYHHHHHHHHILLYQIRDLEAELLDMVCYDVAIEPTLQPLADEELNRGANTAADTHLDVHCHGFWE